MEKILIHIDKYWVELHTWSYLMNIYASTMNLKFIYWNSYVVKISYARQDIITVHFKFAAVAYTKSLIETQSQDRHIIYLGKPSRGRKPSKNSFVQDV